MRGLIHGTMHLSIGQEASAVGTCWRCATTTTSPRRIAATATASPRAPIPTRMFAEFFGKENGYCRGRGGSMHIADVEGGNLGANGIVGGGLPIAVGAALQHQDAEAATTCACVLLRRRRDQRRRLPRGAQHGVDLEAAGGLRLREQQVRHVDARPSARWRCRTSPIAPAPTRCRASPSTATTCSAVAEAVERGDRARPRRRGSDAHRVQDLPLRGHSKSDRNLYRTKEEIEDWREARSDSPSRGANWSRTAASTEAESRAIERGCAARRSTRRIEFAKASPDPDPRELTRDVYAD